MAGLGDRLAELRKAKGWSLRSTARRLGWSSHAQLSEIERGSRHLPDHRIADVARVFGVDPEELRALRRAAASPADEPASGPAPAPTLPPRRSDFVGRESVLLEIADRLAGATRVALVGLGGIGKTEVALEFAHRATDYADRRWVDGSSRVTMRAALEDLADLGDRGAGVRLLVVDDCTSPDDVVGLLASVPVENLHVLATSRSTAWAGGDDMVTQIEVPVLSRPESIDMLLARSPGAEAVDALTLADRLGCLPLALAQASAYAEQCGLTLPAYLELLERRPEVIDREADPQRETVATTWTINLNAATESRATREWLSVACFLAPSAIPLRLFETFPDPLDDELRAAIASTSLTDVLIPLVDHCLIRVEGSTARIHPLLQETFRRSLDAETAERAVRSAIGLVTVEATRDETWGPQAQLINDDTAPSLVALAAHAEARRTAPASVARGLYEAAAHAHERGRLAQARDLIAEATTMLEAMPEPDPVLTWDVRTIEGVCLTKSYAFDTAERSFRLAAEAIEPVAEEYPRRALMSAMNLGAFLGHCDRWEEAAGIFERGLEDQARLLGEDDPGLVDILANVASAYVMTDRFADAISASRRGLDLIAREAPGTSFAEESLELTLAVGLRECGDADGARRELENAVARAERERGDLHPALIEPLTELGETLRRLGQLDEARRTLQRAIHVAERIDPPQELQAAESSLHLAEVERDADRPRAALRIVESTLERLEGMAPDGHRVVIRLRDLRAALQDAEA